MLRSKIRKEVALDSETITLLQIQAEKEGRKLKNYMEYILKEKSVSFKLSDAYKLEMDALLERHNNGKLEYLSKENFFKQIT